MAKKRMNMIDWLAIIILTVGGLAHGAQAFGYYAVEELLKFMWLYKAVYGLIGLAGVYCVYIWIMLGMKKKY